MTRRYDHTQYGVIHYALYVLAAFLVATPFARSADEPGVEILMIVMAIVFAVLGAAFARLRVTEERDGVRIAFGPLPLASRRLRFADVRDARPGRSTLLDGIGIHWVPGRGWIWNVRGGECVEVDLVDGRTLRIGTDDAEGLAALLREHATS